MSFAQLRMSLAPLIFRGSPSAEALCDPLFAAHRTCSHMLLGSCFISCDPDALPSLQGHLLLEDNDAVLHTLE